MLNIWTVKKKQQQEASSPRASKRTAGHIRVQKDISELEEYSTMKPTWEDYENDPLNFTLTIRPDEGMYQGGVYVFRFKILETYPHDVPTVKCTQKIYHPNIDLDGNICLNILREDWKPVLNLNSIFVGLQYLFLEPNADDPLNKDAAEVLRRDREQFVRNVKYSITGGTIDGVTYDDVRGAPVSKEKSISREKSKEKSSEYVREALRTPSSEYQ
ncbi:uncharacterized protein FOMMEDRAFT_121777 [Fomitiporia mediterranea MF3/22]|uniref:uncharacterized protein n=1 Tax=Fomitiporia mediterranea (strain MF3/22) TaxID=694068 RepID=UPI00044086F2|nr:uncharacterized protein FOMMEDRAFT_121777 [Fomitiporia mediterranea MF3/22]EJD04198.1 hypothetical protein FOMMEDRAFT_121777 [Fomitiporia mediterranea MF3/22]